MSCRRYTERELHYLRRALRLRRSLTDKALAMRLGRTYASVLKAMCRLREQIP